VSCQFAVAAALPAYTTTLNQRPCVVVSTVHDDGRGTVKYAGAAAREATEAVVEYSADTGVPGRAFVSTAV
jgi:hypothetical protein